MDSSSFDRLTRLFASARSRRTFGGALLGSVAGLLGLPEAKAAHCPAGTKHCGRRCIPKRNCCTNADCQPKRTGQVCRQGRCQCPVGKKHCPGRCIPTAQSCTPTCPPPPPECTTPADCPAPPSCQKCAEKTCVNGRCGVGPVPANPYQPCRAARGDCDVPEFCDGSSLECPADEFQPASYVCLVPVCDFGPAGPYGIEDSPRPAVYCTGDGPTCPPRSTPAQSCGFYRCMSDNGSALCRTTCQTDEHCIQGAHCEMPACVPD
jgi:hypothetical protein